MDPPPGVVHRIVVGSAISSTTVAALVDTNVLVYRFDHRDPRKQSIATDVIRRGLADESLVVAHQGILEFVAATTRPLRHGHSLLPPSDAWREAEDMLRQFPVLFPDEAVVRTALRGAAAYQLSWFDAHMWAYAEVNGLETILSEDFEDGRYYGKVRVIDPFRAAK